MISDIIVLSSTFADKIIENQENQYSTEYILKKYIFYKENNVFEIKND